MAGKSNRFKQKGIKLPKYQISVLDKTLFEWSMSSLKNLFTCKFIFIVLASDNACNFIKSKCEKIGITNFNIIELLNTTDGQASTAINADKFINENSEFLIFNIDTYVESNNIHANDFMNCDGFIPVFETKNDKFSFIKNYEDKIIHIEEKIKISDLATVGLYYFSNWNDFKNIFYENEVFIHKRYGETYIAPLYNAYIKKNKIIRYKIIPSEEVHILGTPEEVLVFEHLNRLREDI